MRRKSHQQLGRYLAQQYLSHLPRNHLRAFCLGCVEPDWNPATYLKGSLRHQWLRGHNYPNARHFMGRIARRLEGKQRLSLADCYTLGKLIHYTADAFTQVHNAGSGTCLAQHRQYEAALQTHFLQYLQQLPQVEVLSAPSIMEALSRAHVQYQQQEPHIRTDARFALNACCCVLAVLLSPRIF